MMRENSSGYLCFIINGQKFAIPLDIVESVIRSQAITQLEKEVSFLRGIIDFHGEIIPIISLRNRFNLPTREIQLTDRLIIINTGIRKVGLIAEHVDDIIDITPDQVKDSALIFNGLKHVKVLSHQEGLILIYDIESIISKNEEIELQHIWQSQKL